MNRILGSVWGITFLLSNFQTSCLAQITEENTSSQSREYLTVPEATQSLRLPQSAAQHANFPEQVTDFADFVSIQPIQLFDNLYFMGTTSVGAFIVSTDEGLIMLDTGNDDEDVAMMVADMKKVGLDPADIRLIMISHEHFDHYGGVQYLKKNVCPKAKVAMSLVGWNMLQTVPLTGPYIGKRPESVDIYLTDGMKIKVGHTIIDIISTPGHSPGCMSFIIPVTDQGEPHMAGIMGGSAVFPTWTETWLYKASIEYYKAFAMDAGCDVGLYFHSQEEFFTKLRSRKPGEDHPLILGKEGFDTIYLNSYRKRVQQMIDSGKLKPF
jgi:metallo-beta-lactamase class B